MKRDDSSREYHRLYMRDWRKRMTPEQREKVNTYQREYSRHQTHDPVKCKKRRKQKSEYHARCPDVHKNAHYKWKYGITLEEKETLFDKQQGICPICGNFMTTPVLDHCHTTGRVRGILCRGCNVALGRFKDDPAILQKAIDYLQGV